MNAMHKWAVGDEAIYVAGPPTWADYVGKVVRVVHVGWSKYDGRPCATIERLDTGDRCGVLADERNTNIKEIL